MTQIIANTSKEYPCIMCGGPGNIIREDAVNPRVKCRNCNFMYDAKDSQELAERGQIPSGPPDLPEIEEENANVNIDKPNTYNGSNNTATDQRGTLSIPRSPSHIFITKDRKIFEFTTEKDFKKKLLKWESSSRRYDVFQLMKFEYSVKVDVRN